MFTTRYLVLAACASTASAFQVASSLAQWHVCRAAVSLNEASAQTDKDVKALKEINAGMAAVLQDAKKELILLSDENRQLSRELEVALAKSKTLIAEKDELAGSLTEARGGTDEVVSKLAELEAKLDVAMQEKGELADVNQELRGDLGELEKLLAESGKLLDETVAELSRSNAALRDTTVALGVSEDSLARFKDRSVVSLLWHGVKRDVGRLKTFVKTQTSMRVSRLTGVVRSSSVSSGYDARERLGSAKAKTFA